MRVIVLLTYPLPIILTVIPVFEYQIRLPGMLYTSLFSTSILKILLRKKITGLILIAQFSSCFLMVITRNADNKESGGAHGSNRKRSGDVETVKERVQCRGGSVDTFVTVTVRPGVNLWYEGESGFVKTTNNQEQTIEVKPGTILTVTYEPPGLPGSIYCVGDVVPISNIRNESNAFDSISNDLKLTLGRCFLVLGDCQIYWTSEKG